MKHLEQIYAIWARTKTGVIFNEHSHGSDGRVMVEGEALTCMHTVIEELHKPLMQMDGFNRNCISNLPMIKS